MEMGPCSVLAASASLPEHCGAFHIKENHCTDLFGEEQWGFQAAFQTHTAECIRCSTSPASWAWGRVTEVSGLRRTEPCISVSVNFTLQRWAVVEEGRASPLPPFCSGQSAPRTGSSSNSPNHTSQESQVHLGDGPDCHRPPRFT